MKRTMVILLCLAVGLTASAAYKIHLVNGKIITADDDPEFKNERVYFFQNNLYCFLSVDKVDLMATEEANLAMEEEVVDFIEEPIAQASDTPRKLSDENIEDVRNRSSLANEGELQEASYDSFYDEEDGSGEDLEGSGGEESGGAMDARMEAIDRRLDSLNSRKSSLESQKTNLQATLKELRQQHGFTVQMDDKIALDEQIQDTQDDLSSVNTQLRNTNSDIQATNRERVALQMEGLIPVPAEAGE